MAEPATNQCPFCSETVLATARNCKRCGEFLDAHAPPDPATMQLGDICQMLGGSEAALRAALGPPDGTEVNEYGTRFLFYKRYFTIFLFSSGSDIAAHADWPKLDAFGHTPKLADGALQFDGFALGMSRGAVEAMWGIPTAQNEYWMEFRHRGRTRIGTEYGVVLYFGDSYDDGHDGLTGISGRLTEDLIEASRPTPAPSGPPSPSATGGGCFIATAAFGESDASVLVLRNYRDRVLRRSAWGRRFVVFYYRWSPPVARFIEPSPLLRRWTRLVLSPVVSTCRAILRG